MKHILEIFSIIIWVFLGTLNLFNWIFVHDSLFSIIFSILFYVLAVCQIGITWIEITDER